MWGGREWGQRGDRIWARAVHIGGRGVIFVSDADRIWARVTQSARAREGRNWCCGRGRLWVTVSGGRNWCYASGEVVGD